MSLMVVGKFDFNSASGSQTDSTVFRQKMEESQVEQRIWASVGVINPFILLKKIKKKWKLNCVGKA